MKKIKNIVILKIFLFKLWLQRIKIKIKLNVRK
jgi:hypothetical protein